METTGTDAVISYTNVPTQEVRIEVDPLVHGPASMENKISSSLLPVTTITTITTTTTTRGCCPLLFLVLWLAIPIHQLMIGRHYRHECPIQPKIPHFLYTGGIVGIISAIFPLVAAFFIVIQALIIAICAYKGGTGGVIAAIAAVSSSLILVVVTLLLHLFLFIWLIFGAVWTFGVLYKVNFDEKDEKTYCHRTLYIFTFVLLVLNLMQIIGQCCHSRQQAFRGSST
jgi:hypothetical protein